MTGRRIAVYYAWSRPGEIGAPLGVIENRFPALFEIRRMLYPRLQEFTDPSRFTQSVAGFLDHIMKPNYTDFVELASGWTGQPVVEFERIGDDGTQVLLDDDLVDGLDTLIVISFDSVRTGQRRATPNYRPFIRFWQSRAISSSFRPITMSAVPKAFRIATGCACRKRTSAIMGIR